MLSKAVLRCASVVCGGQCAVICGEEEMQLWSADNWDTPVQVRSRSVSL